MAPGLGEVTCSERKPDVSPKSEESQSRYGMAPNVDAFILVVKTACKVQPVTVYTMR